MKINYTRNLLFALCFFCGVQHTFCQLYGTVADSQGEPIAFATIYVEGSSDGTLSNENGSYSLQLDQGQMTIVCDFLGYETVDTSFMHTGGKFKLDFILKPRAYEIEIVEVTADKEDPAYAIIRKAQAARKSHLNEGKPYACEMYQKGSYELDKLPTKIMGFKIAESDSAATEIADSIKKVYLSETVSTLFLSEDDFFEIVHSSRISGMSQMYSFNRGSAVEFSFYERTVDLPLGSVANPIGPSAFQYYKFKLLNEFYEKGQIISEIQVIPKNSFDAAFSGRILIIDQSWAVYATHLSVSGDNLKVQGVDSITVSQQYIPIESEDGTIWLKFKSNLELSLKLFGLEVSGGFYGLYSDYRLGEMKPDTIGRKESVRFQDGSNKKDSTYWNSVRPIELTDIEKLDYREKDSVELVVTSPEYLDSVDRVNNEFKVNDLITGYSHRNTSKKNSWSIGSPLTNIKFNPVQGFNTDVTFNFNNPKWSFKTAGNFSIDGRLFRPSASVTYRTGTIKSSSLSLKYGDVLQNLNPLQAPNLVNNSRMSIFFHLNPLKFYNNHFLSLQYGQDIVPALRMNLKATVGLKDDLDNGSMYSFFFKHRIYSENEILQETLETNNVSGVSELLRHYMDIELSMNYQFGLRYTRYPDRIVVSGRSGPRIGMNLKFGIPHTPVSPSYGKVNLIYSDGYHFGVAGYMNVYGIGQLMLYKDKLDYTELLFPPDNGSYILVNSVVFRSLLGMSPYERMSDGYNAYIVAHHNFDGFILNKIPLLRKTGFTLTSRAGVYVQDYGNLYHEYSLGLDKLGFSVFRLFRFDFTASFDGNQFRGMTYTLGSSISLGGENTISF